MRTLCSDLSLVNLVDGGPASFLFNLHILAIGVEGLAESSTGYVGFAVFY